MDYATRLQTLHERIKGIETQFKEWMSKVKQDKNEAEKYHKLSQVNKAYADALEAIIIEFGPAPMAMGILSEMAQDSQKPPLELWVSSLPETEEKTVAKTVFELSLIKDRILTLTS